MSIPCETTTQSEQSNIFCEISSLEAFGDLKNDEMRRKMSEGLVEMNGESVLVEEIDSARDTMQSQTIALHGKQCKGHHLVRDSRNMQLKKTIHRMDSINHIWEGGVQSQAFPNIKNTLQKIHSNSIYGAVLTSNVRSERQRQPSSNQNDFTGNYIKTHDNTSNEVQQAVLDTTMVVEMSKTERDVDHQPRSQSIYGDIVHPSFQQRKYAPNIYTQQATCPGGISRENLSSFHEHRRNNKETINRSHLLPKRLKAGQKIQILNESDVICEKNRMKISTSLKHETSTNVPRMTSGKGKNSDNVTGLILKTFLLIMVTRKWTLRRTLPGGLKIILHT